MRSMRTTRACLAVMMMMVAGAHSARGEAGDIELEAWPEFDIWIDLNEDASTRLYILNSWAEDADKVYEEMALGVSLDQRLKTWMSVRGGIRYIWKQADPPQGNETRAVFDAKFYAPTWKEFLLTNRNRIDLRWIDGELTERYRNRTQLERPISIFGYRPTGFTSYEVYYDTKYDDWVRQRIIVGGSFPVQEWLTVDLFYGYHVVSKPKPENAGAWGLAIGFWF